MEKISFKGYLIMVLFIGLWLFVSYIETIN